MNLNWEKAVERLRAYPAGVHRLLPPCPEGRLEAVQSQLGKMPEELVDMLCQFDGAELFNKTGPFITLFGITPPEPLDPFEWAPDWYIDKYTPEWRRASPGRDREWAIAMKCYGALAILNEDCVIREWETSLAAWSSIASPFSAWFEDLLKEGEAFLAED